MITLQGAIKKSLIFLLEYQKNEWLDGTIIISYFGGSNNIFTDFIYFINLQNKIKLTEGIDVSNLEPGIYPKLSIHILLATI